MGSFNGSDFYSFHLCPHTLTNKLRPGVAAPSVEPTKAQERLWAWGLAHEKAFAAREGYQELPSCYEVGREVALAATREAMAAGEPRLFQAVLGAEGLFGVADLLRRVEGDSLLGTYHYEVGDVKSSSQPKAEQVMQVLFYSYMLERLQGRRPRHGYLILADGVEWCFELDDYWDYFLAVLDQATRILDGQLMTQPLRIAACQTCKWNPLCSDELVSRDDLSLLPGMTHTVRAALMRAEIKTITDLAGAGEDTPSHVRAATYTRLRAQARAQLTHSEIRLQAERLTPSMRTVTLIVDTDFAHHHAAFLIAARWRDGEKSGEAIYLADTPQAFDEMAAAAATELNGWLDASWHVYDDGTRRALHANLPKLEGLPDITALSALLQENWALPVPSYRLEDVAAWLGVEPPGEDIATPALHYHLFVAEHDPAERQALEASARWRLSVLTALDDWLHAAEEVIEC